MGHKAELNRHFSPLAMLGLAFAILNSWTALSASLSLALPSGGLWFWAHYTFVQANLEP